MTTAPASPKRRHILSSINPDRRSASPQIERSNTPPNSTPPPQEPQPDVEQAAPKRASEEAAETGERKKTSKHRHHHHHHHRHKRRRTRSRSPTPPNPFDPPPLDTEAAFRESLFDAMADDEGAAYWENVYGQPIHVYSQEKPGPDGELERMDDDEYAAFVRQKMWEKTHQGLLEERARREERRKRKEREEEEARRLTRDMERSLRRGEERRRRKSWRERFEEYVKAWCEWDGELEGMAWPVRSGRREDVDADAVRDFFIMGIDPEEVGESEFLVKLKEERVRWHPDKIQQKLGGKVDQAVMRDVTAVFQIVDKLWSDTRSKRQ
ncbi:hypothetical protein K449DRAFT_332339 [Hypoxylon sp. EC38]|nr:hypothetical protein K449DRAFT_332339 [Hypoxylon sp. EC38]